MAKRTANPADFIVPLDMNGLSGRMLHMPAPSGREAELLFVYGQHSSLERWWGLMRYVNRFGAVTMPDLPGFGGMESFYKINKKPTIDNFADYLAAFMKMRYKRKKVIIVGMSFGFVVVTRMLQRYPEFEQNVEMLISLVGFTHSDDFSFTKQRYWFYRISCATLSYRLPALFFRYVILRPSLLRLAYHRMHNAKAKFHSVVSREEWERLMETEIWLWHYNDVRTHARTTAEFLRLDNCQKRIDLPVWHILADLDQYFNSHMVEQHLRIVFGDVTILPSKLDNHAPSVVADEKAAALLIPSKLRRLLNKL